MRPWTVDDVDAARLQHDEEIAHWFGFPGVVPSAEQQRQAIERWQADYAAGRKVVSFLVEHAGEVAGTVEIKQQGGGNGELSWAVFPRHRHLGLASRAVRLLVRYAFDELGLVRVAAFAEPDNRASLQTAARAGLRREGIMRGREQTRGERTDYVQLARLATDPEPTSGDGFRAVLNAALPLKRSIAQGLIRDARGRTLLCELTYKQEWDLPGGVVDPHESPRAAVVREIAEELQVDVRTGRLAAVNWLPPYRGWDDAMLHVFEIDLMGLPAEELVARATLERKEIRAVHWCTTEEMEQHAAPYVTRFLRRITAEPVRAGTLYLEDGADPA